MKPAEPITIRGAREQDSTLILNFIQDLARYEKLEDRCVATEDQIRQSLFGSTPAAEVLIAFHGRAPAGFAVFFRTYSTFLAKPGLYLEDLFVRPELRGCGVGQRLFAELLKIAKESGSGRFEWSVLDWNKPAMDFYERLGAEAQGEWIRYRLDEKQISRLAQTGLSVESSPEKTNRRAPDNVESGES